MHPIVPNTLRTSAPGWGFDFLSVFLSLSGCIYGCFFLFYGIKYYVCSVRGELAR